MYLGPHHFQVQSRYFEDSIRFATSSLWFEPFGLIGCALDHEALKNGTVSVTHSRGLFPDGLAFHMPECDPIPEPRRIGELFPANCDTLCVSLAIPARKPNGLNCSPAEAIAAMNGQPTRFLGELQNLHDDMTGMDEKPVRLGRKNIRLLFETESSEGLSTLAIGRISRDHSGHYVYDTAFIPPCVQIGASDELMRLLQRLVEILDEKSVTLARGKAAGKGFAEFSTRDIANFWFLHTVNSALAPLRHFFLTKRGHPEELYTELSRLGGALCTFALDSHPRTLPLYNHLKLDETFAALDQHIRTHLETIVPTNCVSIPLTKTGDYFYEGEVRDQRCMGPSRWVLAVRSPAGEVEVMGLTPKLIKVCSKLFIPELVKRALPGMPLAHMPVPPSAIATRADTQYFAINRGGPCWDHLMQTRQVGVYVPGELPDPELELLVVLES